MRAIVGAVIARNGGADLAAAVADLTAALGAANVLVIDNASTDGSPDALPVEILRLPENRGYAGGAALALAWAARRQATGLLLLNQDARLTTYDMKLLTDRLLADANVGAVFVKVRRPAPSVLLDGLAGKRNYRHKLTTGLGAGRVDSGRPAFPRAIQHGHGAALLVRVAAAQAVGGFDAFLFAYHEEVDLCWRLAQAHYAVLLEPRAVVRHRGPAGDPVRQRAKAYLIARNSLLVARKNGGRTALLRVLAWAAAAALLYYGPRALGGDREARALLAGWRDGLWRRPAHPHIVGLL